jgi:hypothetical protein
MANGSQVRDKGLLVSDQGEGMKGRTKESVHRKLHALKRKKSPVDKDHGSWETAKQKEPSSVITAISTAEGPEAPMALAELLPDVIFRLDRSLRFVYVNRKIS